MGRRARETPSTTPSTTTALGTTNATALSRESIAETRHAGARTVARARGATRVVIRALPRALTKESFERALARDGFQFGTHYDDLEYVEGKGMRRTSAERGARDGQQGKSRSRCYARATDERAAREMMKTYDGAKFVVRERDSDGVVVENGFVEESVAIAERAPCQWIGRTYDVAKNGGDFASVAGKRNELEGTIESDEEYLKFVKSLEGGGDSRPVNVGERETRGGRKTTALLEFLWRKQAQEARANGEAKQGKKKGSGANKSVAQEKASSNKVTASSSKAGKEGSGGKKQKQAPKGKNAAPKDGASSSSSAPPPHKGANGKKRPSPKPPKLTVTV